MTISNGKRRDYPAIMQAVYAMPWALLPAKLDEIMELLDRRRLAAATSDELLAFLAPEEITAEDKPYRVTAGGVAMLDVSGVIAQRMNLMMRMSGGTSTELLGAAIQKALADTAVKGLVLDVNSPGGAVSGVAELSDLIYQARNDKPIVAVADTQMASAAYWIGSAANEVVASPSSTVGSIGVYLAHAETSKLDAAIGIKRSIISAGKYKTVGNSSEPLTDEARAKLQEFVDSAYGLFVEAVARNRRTTVAAVRSGYGQGDVLFAADAVAAGLADRVATLAETTQSLEARFARAAAPGVPAQAKVIPHSQNHLSQLKGTKMDQKLIAALFAKGLITEATEDAAKAFFAGRNETVPEAAATAAYIEKLFAPAAKADPPAAPVAPVVDIDALAAKIDAVQQARAQREREHLAAQTRAACELVGLDAESTAGIVAEGLPMDQVRARIRERMGLVSPAVPRLTPTGSEADKFAAVAAEVLDARCLAAADGKWAVSDDKISAAARPLRHMRLIDVAERSLRVQGVRTEGLPPNQIAWLALNADNPAVLANAGGGAYYGTGNFANLTLNSARKVLQRAYQESPVTWRQWCRQGEPVADFKLNSIVKFGEVSDLDVVPEGHDIPDDSGLTDSREYYVVETYAKIVSFTRQMIINDDLSALSRLPQLMGNAAARTFNKLVYGILTGNPTMADAVALFHASSHGANLLGTGSTTKAPPSTTTVQAMQAVMRAQHGLNSLTVLNTVMRYVIVPAALEATTLALCRSIADPASSNSGVANIFGPNLVPVIEAILDGTSAVAWYGAADSAQVDTIAVHFLQGEEVPFMESWVEPRNDCRQYKVRQTGAAVLYDYRGLVSHTGYSA